MTPFRSTALQAEDTLRVFKTEENRRANCTHGLIRCASAELNVHLSLSLSLSLPYTEFTVFSCCRALASNMIVGVSEGWTKQLQLIGVGYRATVNGSMLVLTLGFSHPLEMPIPDGIQVKVRSSYHLPSQLQSVHFHANLWAAVKWNCLRLLLHNSSRQQGVGCSIGFVMGEGS